MGPNSDAAALVTVSKAAAVSSAGPPAPPRMKTLPSCRTPKSDMAQEKLVMDLIKSRTFQSPYTRLFRQDASTFVTVMLHPFLETKLHGMNDELLTEIQQSQRI